MKKASLSELFSEPAWDAFPLQKALIEPNLSLPFSVFLKLL